MDKRAYDALTRLGELAEVVAEKTVEVANTAHDVVDAVGGAVVNLTDAVAERISEVLDASPLEDPVVPTAKNVWGASTDGLNSGGDLTRQQKIDYLMNFAERDERLSKSVSRSQVETWTDSQIDLVYRGVLLTNQIRNHLK